MCIVISQAPHTHTHTHTHYTLHTHIYIYLPINQIELTVDGLTANHQFFKFFLIDLIFSESIYSATTTGKVTTM